MPGERDFEGFLLRKMASSNAMHQRPRLALASLLASAIIAATLVFTLGISAGRAQISTQAAPSEIVEVNAGTDTSDLRAEARWVSVDELITHPGNYDSANVFVLVSPGYLPERRVFDGWVWESWLGNQLGHGHTHVIRVPIGGQEIPTELPCVHVYGIVRADGGAQGQRGLFDPVIDAYAWQENRPLVSGSQSCIPWPKPWPTAAEAIPPGGGTWRTWAVAPTSPDSVWGGQHLTVAGDGRVYVSDRWAQEVRVYGPDGAPLAVIGDAKSLSPLRHPGGLTVAGQTLIVADTDNGRLARFGLDGIPQAPLTVPMPGTAAKASPLVVAGGPNASWYIGAGGAVFRTDGTGQVVQQAATSVPAFAFAMDPSGEVVVLETKLNGVYAIDRFDRELQNLARVEVSARADPTDLAVDAQGRWWVTEGSTDRVLVVDSSGTAIATYGSAGGGWAPGTFNSPTGIAVAPDGSVYVADSGNGRIQRLTVP